MTRVNEFSNLDNVIDSRDVIARIEELEGNETLDSDDRKELKTLKALEDEASASPDWTYGETLIRATYFKEYAMELADDIGAIDRNAKWPLNCIDWDKAAKELSYDYIKVDFGGIEYLIRG
jgi:hypothetical protein